MADRERLRRQMRARRRALSNDERKSASQQILRLANRLQLLRPGEHVAVYLAYGGELDLSPLITAGRRRGCALYLPVITDYRNRRMVFRRFDAAIELRTNRYGIPEPTAGETVSALRLDLVLAPLVAFDLRGSRLGSGAGFYDRALHRLRERRSWRRPRVIGVGYEFQRVDELASAPWDVPLDGVLTDSTFYRMAPR
ncbi:MAG TPA: 5-formyltetrahydrofolate cyclo-ligase [Steroidobacter sp.]|jgi:5-formyltetrahydrofolate cyclo-ligase|nr:5-formyltetrahydrofolate cyclo-ligase [Steroidobacter sp.]